MLACVLQVRQQNIVFMSYNIYYELVRIYLNLIL